MSFLVAIDVKRYRKHRPVIIQPSSKVFERTGIPNSLNERKKKKRKRQEDQSCTLVVANSALMHADAQEKKKIDEEEAKTSKEQVRSKARKSANPRHASTCSSSHCP
jgi:hypothetical protein